jgi:hypothetical protein
LALAQVENEAASARATSLATRTQLNALLGWPLDTPSTVEPALDGGSVPPVEAAIARAEAASAELALAQRKVEEQRAKIALARAMQVPDVTPEAALTRNSEPEFDTAGAPPSLSACRSSPVIGPAGLEKRRSRNSRRSATPRARIGGEIASTATLAQSQWEQYVR